MRHASCAMNTRVRWPIRATAGDRGWWTEVRARRGPTQDDADPCVLNPCCAGVTARSEHGDQRVVESAVLNKKEQT